MNYIPNRTIFLYYNSLKISFAFIKLHIQEPSLPNLMSGMRFPRREYIFGTWNITTITLLNTINPFLVMKFFIS